MWRMRQREHTDVEVLKMPELHSASKSLSAQLHFEQQGKTVMTDEIRSGYQRNVWQLRAAKVQWLLALNQEI